MVKSIMGSGGEKGALAFLKISHFLAVTTINLYVFQLFLKTFELLEHTSAVLYLPNLISSCQCLPVFAS